MATPSKQRGLGRGLDALIQGGAASAQGAARVPAAGAAKAPPTVVTASAKGQVQQVPLKKINRGKWQPRRHFGPEALGELADSIRVKGVLDPIWLRPVGNVFELIAGERRLRAAQLAGLEAIPALLHKVSEVEAREMALIENLQRADLDLIEEAEGYRDLMAAGGLTQADVAKRIGKARATIANAVRLLELSDSIKRALRAGELSGGHAKVLLGVAPEQRDLLAARVMAQGLSVRALEKLVAGLGRVPGIRRPAVPAPRLTDEKTARQLKHLGDRIQQELGTKVVLTPAKQLPDGKREMGRIIIEYFDNEDLSRLLETLNLGDLS